MYGQPALWTHRPRLPPPEGSLVVPVTLFAQTLFTQTDFAHTGRWPDPKRPTDVVMTGFDTTSTCHTMSIWHVPELAEGRAS